MLSIVLVDDHRLLQQGLQRTLESTGEARIVAFADTAEEGLLTVHEHQPDIGIFDLGLPDHSGLWLIRRVRRHFPDMPILVLSMHTEPEVVASTLRTGANGYVRKTADEETLLAAVRAIMAGEIYLEPQIEAMILESDSETHLAEKYLEHAVDTVLGSKELEILKLASEGMSNQNMAREIGVSSSTVKARWRSIFSKLNVQNRTQAVAAAVSLGLLPG